jgi:hypothetical protein
MSPKISGRDGPILQMNARRSAFLVVVASVEVSIGLGLLFLPTIPFALLLGLEKSPAEAILVGRIAGAALLAIGVASWKARTDEPNSSQYGLLIGVLIYNAAVSVLLVYADLVLKVSGGMLWPTVVFHGVLAAWGSQLLRDIPGELRGKPATSRGGDP